MKKKRNMLKRNSGFIVGCFLAAGASFFSADILITEVLPEYGTPVVILPETETVTALAPEKAESKTYETDPFTVTASGNVIKGVEADALKKETETSETENSETDISGTDNTGSQGGTSSENSDSSDDSATGSQGGSDNSYTESGSGNNDSYSDNSSTGSGSYSDGNSYGESIQIQNPGNGDYYYDNGSASGNGSYSDSSNNGSSNNGSGNGSSSDQSGNSNAWTPDDVILSGICSRYIDVSELYSYGPSKIRLIRNEIFAVNGRIFKSQDLMDYFCQKSWYVPTYNPEDFDARMFEYLNDYEEANLKLILEYEDWLATQ